MITPDDCVAAAVLWVHHSPVRAEFHARVYAHAARYANRSATDPCAGEVAIGEQQCAACQRWTERYALALGFLNVRLSAFRGQLAKELHVEPRVCRGVDDRAMQRLGPLFERTFGPGGLAERLLAELDGS